MSLHTPEERNEGLVSPGNLPKVTHVVSARVGIETSVSYIFWSTTVLQVMTDIFSLPL